MYERNAIVLERYFQKKLGYQEQNNLRTNYSNYCELLEKIEKFQIDAEAESVALGEFEDISAKLHSVQQAQEKLYKRSAKLEYNRNILFGNVEAKVDELEKCFLKIESDSQKNQETLLELREDFIHTVASYQDKKLELEQAKNEKRKSEQEFKDCVEKTRENYDAIPEKILDYIRGITTEEVRKIKRELIDVMTQNGEKEKIPFDPDVVSKAAEFSTEISKKEADCYIVIYDKTKKLLDEIENNSIKIERHRKWKRDNTAKLKFFGAERDYVVQFLDNERLPVMHGKKVHRKLMLEACKNLVLDVTQMNNLYELILREEASRSAKKAYKELYQKSYLRDIEAKERNYEEEAENLELNVATVINSNYWRVEGIRVVYTNFYEVITQIYSKELEEFEVYQEEVKEVEKEQIKEEAEPFELPQSVSIEDIEAIKIEETDSAEEYQNIENEIDKLDEDESYEKQVAEELEKIDEDMPYEPDDDFEDDFEIEEESLLETVMKAKETHADLKAALEAVKGESKKKKTGIFKNLIKMNNKKKKVEG